jgi:hypothetical protein
MAKLAAGTLYLRTPVSTVGTFTGTLSLQHPFIQLKSADAYTEPENDNFELVLL